MIFGGAAGQKTVGHLPTYYTDVPPVVSSTTKEPGPPSTVASLSREYPDKNIKAEYCWLESVRKILAFASDDEENSVSMDNMFWTAYHANNQPAGRKVICPSAVRNIANQIQWKWPEMYGKDKFLVMFGGLLVVMAAPDPG